ncbi:uncharacterized protein LOC134206407, partial [Armigeres subalbatus]
ESSKDSEGNPLRIPKGIESSQDSEGNPPRIPKGILPG